MPNSFAFGMLVLWPVVSVILFRKLPIGRAIIAGLLAGYLILPPPPAGFDFPLLPALTKETIPSLVAFILCLVLYRPGMPILPTNIIARVLAIVFVVSPLGTVLTNLEPVFFGRIGLPGLRLREAVGMMAGQAILIMPFLMARHFLTKPSDQRDLLWALLIGGLAYAPLMLIEVRLSPQLNIWIYGFFQHNFEQMMRGDGFRPIVFLYHGLWVAFFAMTSVLAALALLRSEKANRRLALMAAAVFLFAVLILCKSMASILYAMAFAPMVLLLGARMQIRLAALLAFVALAYPLAKGADLVPDDRMLAFAERIDAERAYSMRFRFDNEAILLERAEQKPLFGWGIWSRHHILDENSGEIRTVTDGRWVLVIGTLGWIGFLAEFGLLALPMVLMWWRTRGGIEAVSPLVGPLILILGINVLDLIPNATITPLTWLIAGAVLGHAEEHQRRRKPVPAPLRTGL